MAELQTLATGKEQKYLDVAIQRDELARNFGGGIPKNSLILAEGVDGAGKSILAQRLTYALVQHGTTVTYISTELNTMTFVEQMDSLDYDVKKEILSGQLLFIPMYPLLGYTKLEPNFFTKILDNQEIFRSEVIMFDTLSFLLIHNILPHTEAFNIVSLLKRYTTLGKTIMFCVDPDHINETFLTLIRGICDIHFNVAVKSFAGQTIRVISTNRFKRPESAFANHIPFKVEPARGLTIEIASFE